MQIFRQWLSRPGGQRHEEAPGRLRRISRFLLLLLCLIPLLFCCGQLALLDPGTSVYADTSSKQKADYGLWPYIVLYPLNPDIVEDIKKDEARYDAPDPQIVNAPIITGEVNFWATPSLQDSTTVAAASAPAPDTQTTNPAAATSTAMAGLVVTATLPSTPFAISTVTLTPAVAASATSTPFGTPSNTPTPFRSRTPSNTPAVTNTLPATSTRTPTRTLLASATRSATASAAPTNTSTFTPTATGALPLSATPTRTFTSSPVATNTPTRTPTRTFTATNTSTPTFTLTNTATPTFTPTNTPTPTSTPTLTSTPTPTNTPATAQLSGRVFEDTNYNGGNGAAFAAGDAGLANVAVELYTSGGAFIASVATNGSGNYAFTVGAGSTYIIRVISGSIGDADTPPTAGFNVGFNSAIAEQTYEHNGVSGNGGAGALGGNDPLVADTSTLPGAGLGDTNATVSVGATNVTGVDFGFAYNLIVNTNDAGQGSLRQFLLDANAIAGSASGQFTIPLTDPNFNTLLPNAFVIRPASALPALTDDAALIDGRTQESNRGDQRPALPDVVINGANAGADAIGLAVNSSNNLIRKLDIRNFNNNNGTGLVMNGTAGGDNTTISENYVTLNTNASGGTGAIDVSGPADGNTFSNNTLTGNFSDGLNVGGGSGNIITGNISASNGQDGYVLRGALMTFTNNTSSNNAPANPSGCGIELGGLTNSVIANNISIGNGFQGGVCLIGSASSSNTIGPNNTITGNAGAGIWSPLATDDNNLFTRNSLSGNGALGIDLNGDGVSGNDGARLSAQSNDGMDQPVFTVASLNGATLTVSGYVGSAPNQSLFGNAQVEIFESDNDSSGYGEGLSYLGSLAADSNGNFSGSLTVSGLITGDRITATASDSSGNTSEFGPNAAVVSGSRVIAGLQALYTFDEGSGTTVNDTSGVGAPLNLTIANPANATWVTGGLSVDASTIVQSASAAAKIIAACQSTNEVTIEAWVQPASLNQGGGGNVARIVSISADTSNRDVALVQSDGTQTDLYSGRLRTTATDNNGLPSLDGPTGSLTTALNHVVYTRDSAGNARLYVNNVLVASGTIGGDFSNWDTSYDLGLANEFTLNRPWLGGYYLVALYSRALTSGEVAQNFNAGP